MKNYQRHKKTYKGTQNNCKGMQNDYNKIQK